jgi:hypothetical protein
LPQLNKEQEGFGLSQSKQKGKDGWKKLIVHSERRRCTTLASISKSCCIRYDTWTQDKYKSLINSSIDNYFQPIIRPHFLLLMMKKTMTSSKLQYRKSSQLTILPGSCRWTQQVLSSYRNLKVKCCGVWVLSQEPDFLEQKEWGGEVGSYYPAIVASLISLKIFGGGSRPITGQTVPAISRTSLPLTIEDILPLSTIWKYSRSFFRFLDAYKRGLSC